ncbi:MAG: DUF503 domain-containing protein [Dehalococcoidia bacterium]
MVVGCLQLRLNLAENHSLKGKRAVVRRVTDRVRNKFNVAIAEVSTQDDHQVATIGVVCVSNDAKQCHAVLMKVLNFVEDLHMDAEIVDVETEIIQAL